VNYASIADLETAFGAAELNQLTSGQPHAATLERALADAAAEVSAHLAARYPLPLPSVPPLVRNLTCDIARYRLWRHAASEEVRQRYEDARRLLEHLAAGRVSLGLPAAEAVRPSLAAAFAGSPPVFRRDDTAGLS
jgi:phage gp36-like protein